MNKYTAANADIAFARVVEEAGEAMQMYGKGLRFGWDDSHEKYGNRTNLDNFLLEMVDLQNAIKEAQSWVRMNEFGGTSIRDR